MDSSAPDRPPLHGEEDENGPREENEHATPSPSRRRRWLPLMVVAGVLLAAGPLLETAGQRCDLVIRLDQSADLTALSVNVLRGDELVWGTLRHFERGEAPAEVRRSLPLSPGRYRVDIELVRRGETSRLERRLDVSEDASEVIIPVR